jgi:integrase
MRGEGRVFQRGRRWWIAYWGFRPNGDTGEVRESAGETEDGARELLKRRLREVANHREGIRKFRGPHQERITVANLLDNLVTDYRQREIKSLRQTVGENGKGGHMKPIRTYFGSFKALTVTPERIRQYIAGRQKPRTGRKGQEIPGLSNAKINREIEVLGRAFKLAVEDGKLTFCPKIPALPENNARTGFFEKAEFEAVAAGLPEPLGDLARFAYLSGWRRSEIVGLQWENVDRAGREIRITTSKNGEGRVLPMDDLIAALLEKRWAAREFQDFRGEPGLSTLVFHSQGRRIGNFTKAWRAACKVAKVPGKLFHDLRRTAVRDMIRGGVSQHVAMAISGHKTPSMFQRYNITSAEDKLDALRRRQSYIETRSEKSNVVPLRAADSDRLSDR